MEKTTYRPRNARNAARFTAACQLAEDFNLSLGRALSLTSKYGADGAPFVATAEIGPARRAWDALVIPPSLQKPVHVMSASNFFKTSGGSQFFQKIGDSLKVICLYDFNPSIERMKYTPDLLQSLKCVEATEDEFLAAQQRAVFMLGISPAAPVPDCDRCLMARSVAELLQAA